MGKKPLTTLHWRMYEFLKTYCIGVDNSVSMGSLALTYGISERKVRQFIKDITENEKIYTVIATSSKGYYVPSNELEMEKANTMLKSRIEGALARYYANTPNDRHWLYSLLKRLENEYDTPPQAQTVIKFNGWEKDINYFGERKDQKYKDLFEFSQS